MSPNLPAYSIIGSVRTKSKIKSLRKYFGLKMYCSERCGISKISVTAVGLALPLNFSFFPSSNCYLHPRHRNRPPRYTLSLFGQLHTTGESTSTPSGHKNCFSMQLHQTKVFFVRLITQIILRTSYGSCWVICSKDRRVHMWIVRWSNLWISNVRLVVDMGPRRRRSSPGHTCNLYSVLANPSFMSWARPSTY